MVNKVTDCLQDYRDEVKERRERTKSFRREVEAHFDLTHKRVSRVESYLHGVPKRDYFDTFFFCSAVVIVCLVLLVNSSAQQCGKATVKPVPQNITAPDVLLTPYFKCYSEVYKILTTSTLAEKKDFATIGDVLITDIVHVQNEKEFYFQMKWKHFKQVEYVCATGDRERVLEDFRAWMVANHRLPSAFRLLKIFPYHNSHDARIQWEPIPEDIKKFL